MCLVRLYQFLLKSNNLYNIQHGISQGVRENTLLLMCSINHCLVLIRTGYHSFFFSQSHLCLSSSLTQCVYFTSTALRQLWCIRVCVYVFSCSCILFDGNFSFFLFSTEIWVPTNSILTQLNVSRSLAGSHDRSHQVNRASIINQTAIHHILLIFRSLPRGRGAKRISRTLCAISSAQVLTPDLRRNRFSPSKGWELIRHEIKFYSFCAGRWNARRKYEHRSSE